jgi:hypothetical protein
LTGCNSNPTSAILAAIAERSRPACLNVTAWTTTSSTYLQNVTPGCSRSRGDRQERPEDCPSHSDLPVAQTTKMLMAEHPCLRVFRGAIVWARLRRSMSHRCWLGRRPPRHSRSPPGAALASEPSTVPPWPGIPPHKPLLSSAVKLKREPGLAPHEHRRRRLVATATHTGCPAPRPKRSGRLALDANRAPGLAGPLRPRAP